MKPVQTGAERRAGKLVSPDLEFCLSVAGITPASGEKQWMSPFVYEPAYSPHLAGRLTGKYPAISEIKRCSEELLHKRQAVVVEGAGGIMVPLNEEVSMLDLMVELDYPIVLVARVGLGTINHTLLSIAALRSAGLSLLGLVFSHTGPSLEEDVFIEDDNPDVIERLGGIPVLGKLGYIADLSHSNDRTWQRFEGDMPGLNLILEEVRNG
jgi:dethiobiotin synthetase